MEHIWREYVHIVSDPAHMLAEVTFMVAVDVLILGLIWPLLRRSITATLERRVMAEHHAIDAEHGITHPHPIDPTRTTHAGDTTEAP